MKEQWQPIKSAPDGWYKFFLVRPKGLHPLNRKPFVPTVVQRVGNDLYSPDNELESLYFGQNEEEGSPFKTELEWHPLPGDSK